MGKYKNTIRPFEFICFCAAGRHRCCVVVERLGRSSDARKRLQ
jgi:hypothetical protein